MKPSFKAVTAQLKYLPKKGEFWWIEPRHGRPLDRPAGSISGKNKSGYRQIYFDGKPYQAAHLAWLLMKGEWPARTVDHENLVRADDRWRNLRLATRSENFANQRCYRNNKSGVKGVSIRKNGSWHAQIQVSGRKLNLGYFPTVKAARAAYVKAAKHYFGEFARAA